MLYPVAPDKLQKFVERLNLACDEARIPRPEVTRPLGRDAAYDEIDKYLDRFEEPEGLVEGHLAVKFRGRTFLVVDVVWPSPLRTLDGSETLLFKDVPVGPSRLGMWAVLQYLPEAE
jgi:hypothetical protein